MRGFLKPEKPRVSWQPYFGWLYSYNGPKPWPTVEDDLHALCYKLDALNPNERGPDNAK
ncbi:hypothetical protein [Stenotrophomonas phage BUCT603]|nr:hypothetical protein [Stenotrophomonas phage BUCT603]